MNSSHRASKEPKLAHVIAVDVAQLGAHLEAYATTSEVHEFRIYHKLGKGQLVKLPIELREHITEYILQPARERLLEEWSQRYITSEDIASGKALDLAMQPMHSSTVAYNKQAMQAFAHFSDAYCDSCHSTGSTTRDCRHCTLCKMQGMPWHKHKALDSLKRIIYADQRWRDAYNAKICEWYNDVLLNTLISSRHQALLMRHFGLSISLNVHFIDDKETRLSLPVTAAFLTISGSKEGPHAIKKLSTSRKTSHRIYNLPNMDEKEVERQTRMLWHGVRSLHLLPSPSYALRDGQRWPVLMVHVDGQALCEWKGADV